MTDGLILTPGAPYRADLVGGPLDGTSEHPVAQSTAPLRELNIEIAGEVHMYVWNQLMAFGNGIVSAGYQYHGRIFDTGS